MDGWKCVGFTGLGTFSLTALLTMVDPPLSCLNLRFLLTGVPLQLTFALVRFTRLPYLVIYAATTHLLFVVN
jgi:hypothetical protein